MVKLLIILLLFIMVYCGFLDYSPSEGCGRWFESTRAHQ